MTPTSSRTSARAFTRQSVERYLEAAAAERVRLELAIAGARARASAVQALLERVGVLDHDGQASAPDHGREAAPEPARADRPPRGATTRATPVGVPAGGLAATRAR